MADTLTLDTAVGHVLRQGGRVCLVGDDQQLGADRRRRHPHRPPAHATGRSGSPSCTASPTPTKPPPPSRSATATPTAVDFYTDRDRIKIADPSGLPDRLLAAWQHDQRARPRLADAGAVPPPGRRPQPARPRRPARRPPARLEVDLADGNQASVGDLIITRRNDRRLTAGRDWVRNGDRWTVTDLTPDGGIRAIHRRTGKPVTLPAGYVREAVELGYATTIHTAQGVTADTTHGLVDELMTREQLYTMVSRGRTANHLYIAVGGDGDPHRILHTDPQEPTATDILQRVLSRTSLPVSATTVRAQHEQAAADQRPRPSAPRIARDRATTTGYRQAVGRSHPPVVDQLLIRVRGHQAAELGLPAS